MITARTVGVAIVGRDGHQVARTDVVAAGGEVLVEIDGMGIDGRAVAEVAREAAMTPGIDLVSVSLAPRARQVSAAVAALQAGRPVLIERPAASSLADLDDLRMAAERGGVRIWERVTTPFDELYRRAGRIIATGRLGEIVLITTHRSYPWAPWREPDERVSGGLLLQSAGYGLDVVRLIAGQRIARVRATDTTLGEPQGRAMRMAAVLTAELEGGGLASIVVDYLSPAAGPWGRDEVRILGTAGRLSLDAVAGTLTWTDANGDQTETVGASSSTFVTEVIAAVRDGRETDPPSGALLESTEWALRAREGLDAERRSYIDHGWSR